MKVAVEEIFGPVLVSIKVDSFDEAMAVANDTEYGLAASLFSDNLEYISVPAGNRGGNDPCEPRNRHGRVHALRRRQRLRAGGPLQGATNKDFYTTYKVNYTRYAACQPLAP